MVHTPERPMVPHKLVSSGVVYRLTEECARDSEREYKRKMQ